MKIDVNGNGLTTKGKVIFRILQAFIIGVSIQILDLKNFRALILFILILIMCEMEVFYRK